MMFEEFTDFEEDKVVVENVLKQGLPRYEDLPVYTGDSKYEDIQALNWSKLNRFASNPMYFKRNPEWKIESSAFELGTYIHRMFLEHDEYINAYRKFEAPINPKTNQPYKSGKEFDKALVVFQESGCLPLTDQMETIYNELQCSIKDDGYEDFIKSKHTEIQLTEEIAGVKCKGKLDIYDEDLGIIDLKTTSNKLYGLNGSSNFYYRCEDYGWFYELTFYGMLIEAATGLFPPLKILALQTVAPYQVCAYEISDKVIDRCKDNIVNDFIPAWKEYEQDKLNYQRRIVVL